MEKELQDFKDKINLKQGFNAYWNKGFDDAVKFLKDNGALSQHDVSGRSEQLVCTFCGINPMTEICKHPKVCSTKEKVKAN
jgi:hypothetical protein